MGSVHCQFHKKWKHIQLNNRMERTNSSSCSLTYYLLQSLPFRWILICSQHLFIFIVSVINFNAFTCHNYSTCHITTIVNTRIISGFRIRDRLVHFPLFKINKYRWAFSSSSNCCRSLFDRLNCSMWCCGKFSLFSIFLSFHPVLHVGNMDGCIT